ncbi:hypothetical protein C5167_034615 [Papaver somniferum]|uniref:Uncharacterized protein n=1 Tax=Papaver somniferum TaxID=3469 RepID=A0A4Y7KHA9_PAPSO|nr:hypothetical protein C5167_034615 [Papaver somniferum]
MSGKGKGNSSDTITDAHGNRDDQRLIADYQDVGGDEKEEDFGMEDSLGDYHDISTTGLGWWK